MVLPVSACDTERGDEMKTSPPFRKGEAAVHKVKDDSFRWTVASVGPETEIKHGYLRTVEDAIRKGKDDSFTPRVLSVGPHHQVNKDDPRNKDLEEVENLKVQIHSEFWTQGRHVDVVKLIKEMVFPSYPEYIQEKHRSNLESFVDMCLKDACFALYIIDAYAANRKPTILGKATFENCITDLLLLENQLPWPLLDRMNTIKFGEKKGRENVIKFMYAAMNRTDSFPGVPKKLFDNALHLVGLLRGLCLIDYSPPEKFPFLSCSAQELDKKGVKIAGTQPKENEGFLVGGMVFSSLTATLTIPFLSIHNDSRFKKLFLNMIAYESSPGVRSNGEITTFIHLNAALLRDSNSVTIAQRKFISTKYDNETIVNLFKEMSTDSYTDFAIYANDERPQFGVVCKLKVWGRELYGTYFNSPGKVIFIFGVAVAVYLQRLEGVFSGGKGHQ